MIILEIKTFNRFRHQPLCKTVDENRVELQRILECSPLLVIEYNLWNTQERFNRHWIAYNNIVNKSQEWCYPYLLITLFVVKATPFIYKSIFFLRKNNFLFYEYVISERFQKTNVTRLKYCIVFFKKRRKQPSSNILICYHVSHRLQITLGS